MVGNKIRWVAAASKPANGKIVILNGWLRCSKSTHVEMNRTVQSSEAILKADYESHSARHICGSEWSLQLIVQVKNLEKEKPCMYFWVRRYSK